MEEVETECSVFDGLHSYNSSCGYCGNGRRGNAGGSTSRTLGGYAYNLSVDEYQCLMERGWRRSGCYVYHPLNNETCCPQYTIRLDTHEYLPNKVSSATSQIAAALKPAGSAFNAL